MAASTGGSRGGYGTSLGDADPWRQGGLASGNTTNVFSFILHDTKIISAIGTATRNSYEAGWTGGCSCGDCWLGAIGYGVASSAIG